MGVAVWAVGAGHLAPCHIACVIFQIIFHTTNTLTKDFLSVKDLIGTTNLYLSKDEKR